MPQPTQERTTCRNLFSLLPGGPRDQIQVVEFVAKGPFLLSQVTQVSTQLHEAAAWGGFSLSLRQALWGLDQDKENSGEQFQELFPDCLRPGI